MNTSPTGGSREPEYVPESKQVSLVDASGLVNGTVTPSKGDHGTVFNYSVEFWDPANLLPTLVELLADEAPRSPMNESDPADKSTTDGKKYYSTLGNLTPFWNHWFQFFAYDKTGPVASSARLLGPTVGAGPPVAIHLFPDYSEIQVGSSIMVGAKWRDAWGWDTGGPPWVWSFPADGGRLSTQYGSWNYTAGVWEQRTSTATAVLSNGSVLVAGGYGSSEPIDSTHLYLPDTNRWFRTGRLIEARMLALSAALPGDKVLVAGGTPYSGNPIASSELYDPSTGNWSPGQPMHEPRVGATITKLASGKILVAGGRSSAGLTRTAELYDPISGGWTLTGNLTRARALATATLLASGQVLVAGGDLGSVPTGSAEIYDPPTGKWTDTNPLNIARKEHAATPLPGGRVLVTGGRGINGVLNSSEVFDAANGTWSMTGAMLQGRSRHGASPLLNGSVLVAGGAAGNYGGERFDLPSGTWKNAGWSFEEGYGFTADLLQNGKVLVIGERYGTPKLYDSTDWLAPPVTAGTKSGKWMLYANSSGVSGTATIVVLPGPPVSVRALPAAVTLRAGEVQEFWVEAEDAFGNRIDWLGASWTVDGGGQMDPRGRFTATTAGHWTVKASVNGIVGLADLTILPGPVTTIAVQPSDVTLLVAEVQEFAAIVRDWYGNDVGAAGIVWSASGGGTIDQAGRFIAGAMGFWRVYANFSGVAGLANVTVLGKPGGGPPGLSEDPVWVYISASMGTLAAILAALLILSARKARPSSRRTGARSRELSPDGEGDKSTTHEASGSDDTPRQDGSNQPEDSQHLSIEEPRGGRESGAETESEVPGREGGPEG
jgi:hypothetical protein